MNARFWPVIALTVLVKPAAAEPTSTPRIEIRIHDHARVPEVTLKGAKKHAAAILRAAGVEVVWRRCAPCPASVAKDPECEQRIPLTSLVLRILHGKMSGRVFDNRDVYGRAVPGNEKAFGYLADVFYNRIDELATRTGSSRSVLLGIFIAHEIGHLLLGADSHSRKGIMCIPFDEMQLRRAVEGNLLFTPPEAKRIRSELARRTEAGAISGRPETIR